MPASSLTLPFNVNKTRINYNSTTLRAHLSRGLYCLIVIQFALIIRNGSPYNDILHRGGISNC
jgi:hypothetical protein